MAHKLAEEGWTVRLLLDDGGFELNGKMDFKKMDDNGKLRGGKHNQGSFEETINGQAISVASPLGGSTFAVSIQTVDGSASYHGLLILDSGGKMAIVGGFNFDTAIRARNKELAAFAQDEGVWVITKP